MKVKLRFDKRLSAQPPALILQVQGEISSGKSLENLVTLVDQTDEKCCVIGMKGVQYVNSSGFGELADLVLRSKEKGKTLYFVELGEKIGAVFETMGGAHFMNIVPTLDEALQRIREGR